jgi:hypothetical protein
MNQRRTNSRKHHFTTPKDESSGLLSRRKYSVMATICEVFLRRSMGVRYFNGRVFAGTLFSLCLHRMILWAGGKHDDLPTQSMWGYYYFDWFIGLFILLSLYHFIRQWHDQAKGVKHYSHAMGDSRLFFLAKGLGIRRFAYATYVFIEPLFVLLLSPFILFYSPYLAIITLLAAFWLCWENLTAIAHEKQLFLDRQDSEIYAGYAMETMEEPSAPAHNLKPIPAFNLRQGAGIRLKAKTVSPSPSVEDILNNLPPELRKLGKEGNTEDSIS